jgi:uncharacterized lipoprotein YajG
MKSPTVTLTSADHRQITTVSTISRTIRLVVFPSVRGTLQEHAKDPREYRYRRAEL